MGRMNKVIESLSVVLVTFVLAVTAAGAQPTGESAGACLKLMNRFDVFNEHGKGARSGRSARLAGAKAYAVRLKRIRRAAAQGNIKAEAALGDMYLEGECGQEKDMHKALELGARAGGYFGIAMMYMDRKKPVQAYEWFTIGLLKDPWYTARDVRLTLRQAGFAHPTRSQVQVYLDRVAMGKQVIRRRLQLLQTMTDMSDAQVSEAKRRARAWLKAHP